MNTTLLWFFVALCVCGFVWFLNRTADMIARTLAFLSNPHVDPYGSVPDADTLQSAVWWSVMYIGGASVFYAGILALFFEIVSRGIA